MLHFVYLSCKFYWLTVIPILRKKIFNTKAIYFKIISNYNLIITTHI
jgi:hypothetical protein